MTIQTLQHIPLQKLVDCWNLAFSDYAVPLQISAEHLARRFDAEGVRMELSVGGFDGDKLVGFVMTGTDVVNGVLSSYNAGTGVVPAYRGQRLTTELYNHLLPLLKSERVKTRVLEVITENHRAFKVYESLGYVKRRMLNCYKGNIAIAGGPAEFELRTLNSPDPQPWQTFWDWQPSWQNGLATISRSFSDLAVVGAFDGRRLIGYIAYNPSQKRVHQFAVDKAYRRRGLARRLFGHIASQFGGDMGVINVDSNSAATNAFLQTIGLKHFLTQHEMTLQLD